MQSVTRKVTLGDTGKTFHVRKNTVIIFGNEIFKAILDLQIRYLILHMLPVSVHSTLVNVFEGSIILKTHFLGGSGQNKIPLE